MKHTTHRRRRGPHRDPSLKSTALSEARGATSNNPPQATLAQATAAGEQSTAAPDEQTTIVATIVERQPDPSYPDGLAALADALVLQMFDSGVGEALRMAHTLIQHHQERVNRRTQFSRATEALRAHLARLDDGVDDR